MGWHEAPEHFREAVRIYNAAADKHARTGNREDQVTVYDAAELALMSGRLERGSEAVLEVGAFVRKHAKV